MTARAAYPAQYAAHPAPHTSSFGNQAGLTGRKMLVRVRVPISGVWGDCFRNKDLPPKYGPNGLNGPKYSLCIRARDIGGFGEIKIFHALPVISSRSGRSGRDPPLLLLFFNRLGFGFYCDFRTLNNRFRPIRP